MIRGQLSEMQRNTAWKDIDPAARASASVLPEGNDPNEPTPEQAAFRARIQRERELDENFGRGEIAQDVGRVASGAGATRQIEQRLADDREKERKAQTDRQLLLQALDQRILELDGIIKGLNEAIAAIDRQLEIGQSILDAIEAGEFDPEDPEHRAFLVEAGIDPDQSEEEIRASLRARMNDLREDRGEYVDRRTDAGRERDGLIERRAQVQQEIRQGRAVADNMEVSALESQRERMAVGRGTDVSLNPLDEEQGEAVEDFFAELDDFDGGAYESFADEVDPEGASPSVDSPERQSNTNAEPEDDISRDSNGISGPSGPMPG